MAVLSDQRRRQQRRRTTASSSDRSSSLRNSPRRDSRAARATSAARSVSSLSSRSLTASRSSMACRDLTPSVLVLDSSLNLLSVPCASRQPSASMELRTHQHHAEHASAPLLARVLGQASTLARGLVGARARRRRGHVDVFRRSLRGRHLAAHASGRAKTCAESHLALGSASAIAKRAGSQISSQELCREERAEQTANGSAAALRLLPHDGTASRACL